MTDPIDNDPFDLFSGDDAAVGGDTPPGDPGRAMVLHPDVRERASAIGSSAAREPEAQLEEAVGLALAIDLKVLHREAVRIAMPRPATLFGQGAVERLAEIIKAERIGLIVVDRALTPVQQRNLERTWKAKVIDRTGLILEIFGARARTREGQMQVELAALTYQRSRLVRSWTHLERQRGGFGFLGGPGESQLEMDRRLIDERIERLKIDLEDVRRTRGLHRRARERVPYPVVALVGYTNAGKSTLFNRLTQATVLAKDMLFATLDPTMRAVDLPGGRRVILSDTVGFISDLPTQLVAAFRATLEEVLAADVILHVRDAAHPDSEAQAEDVAQVLAGLGIEASDRRMVTVLNKLDLLPEEERPQPFVANTAGQITLALSALTGEGVERLAQAVTAVLQADHKDVAIEMDAAEGAALAWLHRAGAVAGRQDDDGRMTLQLRISEADWGRFRAQFDGADWREVPTPAAKKRPA